MNKKKLLSLSVIIIVIAILSFSTLAWFTAQDNVTNTFTVSSSATDFKVDVWEELEGDDEESVVEVGKGTVGTGTGRFDNMEPGVEYLKRVHVQNNSGNDLAGQYIKVEVTFTNYDVLKKLGTGEDNYNCLDMLLGKKFDSNVNSANLWWYDSTANPVVENNEATYTFYLKQELENTEDVVLFEGVQLPTDMDINDALEFTGFNMYIEAFAIQSANIEAPANSGYSTGNATLNNVLYAFDVPWSEEHPTPSPAPTQAPELS